MNKVLLGCGVALTTSVVLAESADCPVSENIRGHENVEWSIGYAYHLTDARKDLPRVLLVGDSICNGYQGDVCRRLEGRMCVSYWASSYCVTSPGYLKLLDFFLSEAKYDVVHFNNGCHSFLTSTEGWKNGFRDALKLIRTRQPSAKIVCALTTPNRNDAKNERVRDLNEAALSVTSEFNGIAINNLYAAMDALDPTHKGKDVWADDYHFTEKGISVQVDRVVKSCADCMGFLVPELIPLGVSVNGKTAIEVERRTFVDAEAVRYRLPEGKRHITGEATEWVLPTDAKIWFQDEDDESISYEAPYASGKVGDLAVGRRVAFPLTAKLPDGSYRMLTEANVADYTDGCAVYLGNGRFGVAYYADTNGFDQVGCDTTPWRVMLVAKDLQALATNDIVRRLCPKPSAERVAKAKGFVRPGRCIWQWLPAGDPKYAEQKAWYDRTKALGFEYYLIDDGWKVWRDGDMNQWACLKKWIDYGKSIGVESFMWVDSKEMRTAEARRAYLAKVKASGAVGIKIDFIPTPSYAQMKWYEETSADTFDLGLMLDYHGAVKPTGREKTWPHEVAREGIRGHEWHITRYTRVLPPEHDCILPFTRLVQGHADYTPMVFEKKELNGYTWARELAQGIVFSAPFLCFGDYPENYLDNPAVELIKALPAVYDETRILTGSEIGECVAVARRKGKDWFVGVENGAAARSLTVKLDFLDMAGGELVGFADAADHPDGYEIDRRPVGKDDVIKLDIRPCGGFAAWIRGR